MVNNVKVRLWERTAANGFMNGISGNNCFTGDTGLTDYDEIPVDPIIQVIAGSNNPG